MRAYKDSSMLRTGANRQGLGNMPTANVQTTHSLDCNVFHTVIAHHQATNQFRYVGFEEIAPCANIVFAEKKWETVAYKTHGLYLVCTVLR